jgi:hypothetical protein
VTRKKSTLAGDVTFIAARYKAIAALVGALATALLVVWPTSHAVQLVIAVLGALVTGGAAYQVRNAGTAAVQDVVDAVTSVVSPAAAAEVATAVTATTTGVLAKAVGTVPAALGDVATVLDTVTPVAGGVAGTVTGVVGEVLDPPAPTND